MRVFPDRERLPSTRDFIAKEGVTAVARRYLRGMHDGPTSDEDWITEMALTSGRDEDGAALPSDDWWTLATVALDAAENDDDVWLLGEKVFGQIWFEDGILERMIEQRAGNPSLQRLYKVMRRRLRAQGLTEGWWFD